MSGNLAELIGFLTATKTELRKASCEVVESLTGSPDGQETLRAGKEALLPALLRLVNDDCREVVLSALKSLVNLTQDEGVTADLLEMGAVGRTMDVIRDKRGADQEGLALMLLSNLTIPERGAAELLQVGKGAQEGLHVARLLDLLVRGPANNRTTVEGLPAGERPDPYEHVTSILTNVTRFQLARRTMLEPGRGLLDALVTQLQSPTLGRRRCAAAAFRNCCLAAEKDGTLSQILLKRDALLAALKPVDGELPKEEDDHVRTAIAEAFLMLLNTEQGRKVLFELNAHEVLRKGYEFEESADVCTAMERCAQLFVEAGLVKGPDDDPSTALQGLMIQQMPSSGDTST